jgi:LysM repeat protein
VPEDSVDGRGGRPDPVAPPSHSNRTVTPAIAGALVVLAASFALSVAFVLANGGLDLPAAERAAGSGAVASVGPTEAGSPPASPAPAATASPETAEASETATSSPTATEPTSTSTLGLTTPRPSSNRYDLLTACPDAPDCWIYVVRQGDNLFSIARYFGVPMATVEALNPWTRTSQLVAGQKLRLPTPTR